MHFSFALTAAERAVSDLTCVLFYEGPAGPVLASSEGLGLEASAPIKTKDFKGKQGEIALVYSEQKESRLLLVGLGKEAACTAELLRRSVGAAASFAKQKEVRHLSLILPKIAAFSALEACLEALLLSSYVFEKLKFDSIKEKRTVLLENIQIIGAGKEAESVARRLEAVVDGVNLTRDLINGNADDVTPAFLAETAVQIGKRFPSIHVKVLDKKALEEEKMGLLLAVGRGAVNEPRLATLEYKGNPSSSDHTVLVGKGITYDTGGLNMKPTGSMETMKRDMSGAATVMAAVQIAAALKLKVNVTAVVTSAENAVDGLSFKPGDVYRAHSGKMVEIANTDAEGRLVLADALSYSQKYLKPTRLVTIATLTGAIVVALGNDVTGLFSNNDDLAKRLFDAGERTYERVWRLPLYDEYKELIKSDVADISNSGGRPAGSITAALFLQAFVNNLPWAHLDIAGTSFFAKDTAYRAKFASGVGVRLFTNMLEAL